MSRLNVEQINVDQIRTRTGTGTPVVREIPAFLAYRNGNKSVGNAVWTTADFNAVDFDTNSWFDTATGRYTPQIAGYYQFNSTVYMRASASMNQVSVGIAKNGTAGNGLFGSYNTSGSASSGSASVGGVIYLNGSTDYVEGVVYGNGTSPYLDGTGTIPLGATSVGTVYVSYLTGFLVRPD